MIGVIIASRKIGINPDNVATPIAASLGDLITLSLLAGISTGLYKELGNGDLYLLGCMGPLCHTEGHIPNSHEISAPCQHV